jgi:preprotein translocase subunit SecF
LVLGVFLGAWYRKVSRPAHTAFLYSVEFTGGMEALFTTSAPLSTEAIESALRKQGYTGVACRTFTGSNDVIVRIPEIQGDPESVVGRMKTALEAEFSGVQFEVRKTDAITAGVGQQMRDRCFWAVFVAVIAMLLYLALRFWSFSYGMGAVAALIHDIFVILAFVLIFDIEVSLNVVSAILAVLGYSVNDTIVIFARIREMHAKKTGMPLYDVVNMSLNDTLRRTILTSIATTVTVLPLALFGGEVLRPLSLVLLVGFVFGTYSSIYIASPVMMALRSLSKHS